MNALIAFLLGILTAVTTRPNEHQNSGKLKHATYEQSDTAPVARPDSNVPPSVGNKENPDEQKKQSRDTIKFWVEVGGLIILFAYAAFTLVIMYTSIKSADAAKIAAEAAKKQADLAWQQAIALQQAVVKMSIYDFQLESPALHPVLPINFRNEGIAIATGVSFHGAFTWKSEPEHVTVGQPTPINIEIASMPQGDKGARGYMLTIPELNQDVMKVIRTSTKAKTIELRGKFTYSNGFNQIISEDICKVYFAHEQLGNSSDAGFIDCDQYAAKVKFWQNLEQKHRQP